VRNVIVALFVFLGLSGCETVRYRWSLVDAQLAPSAQRLPRNELEEIVRLVSPLGSRHILAIGRSCPRQAADEMNVLCERIDSYYVYWLRKRNGHWYINHDGTGSYSLAPFWVEC
jgi:hypothetical protein